MTDPIADLDAWLRTDFVRANTRLEEAYFAESVDVIIGRPALDALKADLLRQGGLCMAGLGAMPQLPSDPDERYRLLGMLGHYLAACQRHEAPLSDQLGGRDQAWALSSRIGSSLGVAPRLVFAHQCLANEAVAGRYRMFTTLPEEEVWIQLNGLAVLAYRRAAHALGHIAGMGVSNPLAAYFFDDARDALHDVLSFNQQLRQKLDVNRFYFNIRPYFKTYEVNHITYRGTNAGDFSAINEIDVTLGLCSTRDPFYQAIVWEKARYVPPCDQPALRSLDGRPSLLNAFCSELDSLGATPAWRANAEKFLNVCKAHGAAYAYHHQQLVKPFLEAPARLMPLAHASNVTSSGPPLDDVINMLARLMALRTARELPGAWTAAPSLDRIRQQLSNPS